MALDRSPDLLAHRFSCFSLFLSVLVTPHVRQTKMASSLVNFSTHIKVHRLIDKILTRFTDKGYEFGRRRHVLGDQEHEDGIGEKNGDAERHLLAGVRRKTKSQQTEHVQRHARQDYVERRRINDIIRGLRRCSVPVHPETGIALLEKAFDILIIRSVHGTEQRAVVVEHPVAKNRCSFHNTQCSLTTAGRC